MNLSFVLLENFEVSSPGATGIRDHMVQSVELKFNCFLLMPVVDAFPSRLRAELEVGTLGCIMQKCQGLPSHP